MNTVNPEIQPTPVDGVVAIVDDDPHISRALGLWLELYGLHTTHHTSGESLLNAICKNDEHVTLHIGVGHAVALPMVGAVLDLNLPGITGIELALALRRVSPTLPMAIITALHEDDRERFGHPPPGVQCLKKPFDLGALEDALFPLLD